MAKPFLLSFSLCLVLFTSACLAERFNECQLDSINALEPDSRVESEAGVIETWNSNRPELQCAGVTVIKHTIDPQGLHLPSYANYAQLTMILQGEGVLGISVPGCSETFEEPAKPRFRQRHRRRSSHSHKQQLQDSHQKIRHFKEGDILAIPPGLAYWTYNYGEQQLVAVSLLDTSSSLNQLDSSPRRFYLAGNPEEEHPETQVQGRQQQQQSAGGRRRGQHQQEEEAELEEGNVLSGFDPQFLSQAFSVDEETIASLQSPDRRKQIVRVKGGLSVISPEWEEESEEEEEEEPQPRPRQRGQRGERQERGEGEEEQEEEPRSRERREPQRRRSSEGRRGQEGEEEEEEEPREEGRGRKESHEWERTTQRKHAEGEGGEEEEEETTTRESHYSGKGHGQQEEEEEEEQQQSSRRQGRQGGSGRGQQEEEEEQPRRGRRESQRGKGRKQGQQQQQEEEEQWPQEHHHRGGRSYGSGNGLEETICTARLRENIANPSRADFYNPTAGRISTVNSLTLPILRWFQLSAEYVFLYRNGIYAPHWNINANSVIYASRGKGWVQVVNCTGSSVFNGELRKGQLLVVPQNYVVAHQAGDEGFEFIAFKTNDLAAISPVKQVFRSIPAEVLANAFGIRLNQVSKLKYNGNQGPLVSPPQSQDDKLVKVA